MQKDLIRAAGGIVVRKGSQESELLLVHRNRYDDWSLPKGKLKKSETWLEAAQREVREETGIQVQAGSLIGDVFYYVDGSPKIVLFWEMTPVVDQDAGDLVPENPDEVSDVCWVSVSQALERLSYDAERALVLKFVEMNREP